MTNEEVIISQLIRIGNLLENLQPNRMMKIPQASKELNVCAAILRTWCKEAKIPCTRITKSKQAQYLIDVPAAREIILKSKHLFPGEPIKRGRKSTLNLSI